MGEFQSTYKAKDENLEYEKELKSQLNKLTKTRQKYMDMYTGDLISRQELNDKIGGSRKEMERLENELKMVSYHLTKGEQLESVLNHTFKEIEDITDVREMTNTQLKRIIQKIDVDKEGNVEIFLRLFGDLGLEEAVLIEDSYTASADASDSNKSGMVTKRNSRARAGEALNKSIPNNDNHTLGYYGTLNSRIRMNTYEKPI